MFGLEENRIYPSDRAAVAELDALLKKEGINRDANLDYTLGIYENDVLIATGSYFGNTLRCLAVDSDYRGIGLLNRVVSRLVALLAQQGIFELFVYTKVDKAAFFKDLGFFEICRVDHTVAFLENRRGGFEQYLERLSESRSPGPAGAIVMNANPFTLGHLYLVEQAAAQMNTVHLFVVTQDASLVPFDVRFRLVREGVAHLQNVVLHETGNYMVSTATFPSYFLRDAQNVIRAQAQLDIEIFKRIAGVLGIGVRYVGEEPFSEVTGIYNAVMQEELGKANIGCIVIPRKEENGSAISASAVRRLIKEGDLAAVRPLVPETTLRFFESDEGERVAARIRQAVDVVHY